jgi:hypothetical protein
VTRDGDKWHVELDLALPDGNRRRDLDGDSCAEVSVAAATVIALAVDPNAAASEPPARPVEQSTPRTTETPAKTPPPADGARPARVQPAPEHATSSAHRLGFAAEVFGLVDARSLPGASPGLGAGGAVIVAPLRVDLTLATLLPRRATLGTAHADVSLTVLALRAAWEFHMQRFTVRPGVIAEGGRAAAKSESVAVPGQGTTRWWAVGPGCILGVEFGRHLALDAGLDVLGLLARDEFVIVGRGPIFRPPPFTVRGTVGAEWRW